MPFFIYKYIYIYIAAQIFFSSNIFFLTPFQTLVCASNLYYTLYFLVPCMLWKLFIQM